MKYLDVLRNDNVNIGVFLIPKGKEFPLHDHPAMNVFSFVNYGKSHSSRKVLFGAASVISYDWVDDPSGPSSFPRRACVAFQNEYTKSSPLLEVFPKKNNLHKIVALENCALMDISIPPYSDERLCTYYVVVDAAEQAPAKEPEGAVASLDDGVQSLKLSEEVLLTPTPISMAIELFSPL